MARSCLDTIGAMRERIALQTATSVTNTQGGRTDTWTTVDTVPAEAIEARASEILAARAIQATVERKFRVRVRSDLSPKMRVVWTPSWPAGSPAVTLEVHGVVPVGDGRLYALLICGEVVAS